MRARILPQANILTKAYRAAVGMMAKAYIPPGIFGHVGPGNAINFALGTFQIYFSLIKIQYFEKAFA